MENKPLILYDGYCNLCNRFIIFIRKADKKKKFRLIPAGQIVKISDLSELPDTDSVFLIEKGEIFTKSDAVLKILKKLPFPWYLGYIFKIIPKKLRDAIYLWVAKNRYRWFGRKDSCILQG